MLLSISLSSSACPTLRSSININNIFLYYKIWYIQTLYHEQTKSHIFHILLKTTLIPKWVPTPNPEDQIRKSEDRTTM